jgi:hypothetical protein
MSGRSNKRLEQSASASLRRLLRRGVGLSGEDIRLACSVM